MSCIEATRGALIRPYRPADRDALYAVCLATGDEGEDATHLFRDGTLLGHRYVGPYLDLEPELSFTLEDDAGPCGYVLGTDDSLRFYRRFEHEWLPALRATLPPASAGDAAKDEDDRLLAELHAPTITLPRELEAYPAHLHIDILPRAQGRGHGRRMVATLLAALVERGADGVHLGVGQRNVRAQGFYRAFGFVPIDAQRDEAGALLLGRRLP